LNIAANNDINADMVFFSYFLRATKLFHEFSRDTYLRVATACRSSKHDKKLKQVYTNNHSKKTFKQSIQETSNLNINEQLHYNIAHDNHTK
jgi:hypothetical protein